MNRQTWRVALVGFGRMAAGYAADAAMAKYYPYAAHAQVLRDHPRLDWKVVVEPDPIARQVAISNWKVPIVVSSIDELGATAAEIDIVVFATPPSARLGILQSLPGLRAVIAEKPLGENLSSANQFLKDCSERELMVQVNFWRRADRGLRGLANGDLIDLIGEPIVVNCLYGNGLLNNGSHMIDLVRMFFGEVENFRITDPGTWSANGPIPGDINPTFSLRMDSGLIVSFSPIDFRLYRENGMIIWGSNGRLDILNEGLVLRHFPAVPNRAMTGEREIANDSCADLQSTVGYALYWMYDNLLDAIEMDDLGILHSPSSSALVTSRWVDEISRAVSYGLTS
jgi:predicted dehydrogenase